MIQTLDILEKLLKAARKLGDVRTTAGLYDSVFAIVSDVFGCEKAAILLKHEFKNVITVVAKTTKYTDLEEGEQVKIGEGVKGRSLATRQIQIVSTTIDSRRIGGEDPCEAAIPLIDNLGSAYGVISMIGPDDCFNPDTGPLLSILGDMISMGVINLKFRGDVEERARRLAVISKAIQTVASDVDRQTLLHKSLELTRKALNPDGCSVQLYSDDGTHLVVAAAIGIRENYQGLRIPKDRGVQGVALETRRPSLEPNMADSKAPARSPLATDYLSELAVPLVYRNDVMGVLHLGHRQAGVYDETDLLTASILADCVAEGLGTDRMQATAHDKDASRDAELGLFYDTVREAGQCGEFAEIFSEVFPQSASFLRLKRAAILSPYSISTHLKISHVFGYEESAIGQQIPLEESLTGEAYRTAQTVYSLEGKQVAESAISQTDMPVKAAVPMKMNNEVVAVLFVDSDIALDPSHLKTLETVAGQLSPYLIVDRMKAN